MGSDLICRDCGFPESMLLHRHVGTPGFFVTATGERLSRHVFVPLIPRIDPLPPRTEEPFVWALWAAPCASRSA
jgi:hypothetical protein